jgi:hypothetical protein
VAQARLLVIVLGVVCHWLTVHSSSVEHNRLLYVPGIEDSYSVE